MGKRKKSRALPKTEAPVSELALDSAEKALNAALRSDKDGHFAERVGKASIVLLEVQQRVEAMAARASERELEKRRLEIEERRLALLEAREEREQKELEAAEKKGVPRALTIEYINKLRAQTFGLPPLPIAVGSKTPVGES